MDNTGTGPKYPNIEVQLSGQNGNAFNLMGIVRRALRTHRVPQDEIDAFFKEATSGDYDHLLATCARWVHIA